jgi:hypothetical protein
MHLWYFPPMLNSKLNCLLHGASKKRKVQNKLWRKVWRLAGGLFSLILAFFIPREALLITIGVITGIFVTWEIARFISPSVKQWSVSRLRIIIKREERL